MPDRPSPRVARLPCLTMKVRTASFLLLLGLTPSGQAGAPARQDFQALRTQAASWLEAQVQKNHPDTQVQVRVGPVDERLNLPACSAPVFFLPKGVRLWGNGSLGARCEEPGKWRLYLSFESALRGPALVATRALPARAQPGPGDLALRLVDYQADPERYLREWSPGATLSTPLAAGQALLADHQSQAEVIRAGQKVRIVARGPGFDVTQEGVALGSAVPGDKVRAKTPAGRIVQGVAARDGSVQVTP